MQGAPTNGSMAAPVTEQPLINIVATTPRRSQQLQDVSIAVTTVTAAALTVRASTSRFELAQGLKSEVFDRRVRPNSSALNCEHINAQVNNSAQTLQFISKTSKARNYNVGDELDILAAGGLTLSASLAYTHDCFTEYPLPEYTSLRPSGCITSLAIGKMICMGDASGDKLPGTRAFTCTAGASYDTDLGNRKADFLNNLFDSIGFCSATNDDARSRHHNYELLDASIFYQPAKSAPRLSLWRRSLADQKYDSNIYTSAQQVTYRAMPLLTDGSSLEQRF